MFFSLLEGFFIVATEPARMHSFRSQLPSILLLTTLFFLNFISRVIFSPLMPTIEADLHLSHTDAGSLFFILSAGYFFSLLTAGFISSFLTHRQTIILSTGGVGCALLLLCFTSKFWHLRFGCLVLGLAAGLYLPSGIATITSLIESRNWGKGLAVHELAPNLGFVMAPLVTGWLLKWLPWQGILAVVGVASLCGGLAFLIFGKGGRFAGDAPTATTIKGLLGRYHFWLMAILFSLGIGGSLGIYAILPLYLVSERGMGAMGTHTLVALSRVSGLGMGFAAGWASDRFGPPAIIAIAFSLTGLFTVLLGFLPGQWILLFVFLQPMIAVCFFPAGFAALSSMVPPGARNVAVSLTVPLGFLVGGGLFPAFIGWMGDVDTLAHGIMVAGGVICTGFVLSKSLKGPLSPPSHKG